MPPTADMKALEKRHSLQAGCGRFRFTITVFFQQFFLVCFFPRVHQGVDQETMIFFKAGQTVLPCSKCFWDCVSSFPQQNKDGHQALRTLREFQAV